MNKRFAFCLAALAAFAGLISGVAAEPLCRTGQSVDALWQGKYYKASVIDVSGVQCKITYTGYGKEFDEWVGPERLTVKVMWKGAWYPARVLRQEAGGYMVSYDGYGSEFNEVVPVSRIEAR